MKVTVSFVPKALVSISELMSSGRYEDLKGLATDECITQVRERLAIMNVAQRTSLRVVDSDVYLAFPYQIGMIIYDESSGKLSALHIMEVMFIG